VSQTNSAWGRIAAFYRATVLAIAVGKEKPLIVIVADGTASATGARAGPTLVNDGTIDHNKAAECNIADSRCLGTNRIRFTTITLGMPARSMTRWTTVAIVGIGLLGGSIGLALRQRGLAVQVIGIGRSTSRLQQALDRGAITQIGTNLPADVAAADLTVVCTPVAEIVAVVRQVSQHCPPGALITDVGSTKETVCAALADDLPGRGVFIGSHPLAGSEKSGVEHADANLFAGRPTVVTPREQDDPQAIARIVEFWAGLGSRVVQMSPAEHDRAVAAVSHLPHMVAAVLAASVDHEPLRLASTGWRSTTRVAAGNPDLWRQIFVENQRHVLQSLDNFEKVLASFRQALQTGDQEAMLRILEAGKRNRDSLGS
jgi:prephenate dehydrogenase